ILSILISGWPASKAAPSRFSVSSVSAPVDMTGIGWPMAIAATMSHRKLLPDPAVGALLACNGVTENAPRTTGVIIADNAQTFATSSTKGNRDSPGTRAHERDWGRSTAG